LNLVDDQAALGIEVVESAQVVAILGRLLRFVAATPDEGIEGFLLPPFWSQHPDVVERAGVAMQALGQFVENWPSFEQPSGVAAMLRPTPVRARRRPVTDTFWPDTIRGRCTPQIKHQLGLGLPALS
jgi:hypothetical protein